jgi:hypothetical protein
MRPETGAAIESSREVQSLRVVRLMPGRVAAPFVTFTVPPGWYGFQDEIGFVLDVRAEQNAVKEEP